MSCSQNDDDISWRGCSMEEIYRCLHEFELKHVPPVRPSDGHTVLYYFPTGDCTSPPKPLKGHHKWDASNVRLPSSAKSQYPITKDDGTVSIENRWEMIEKALLQPIKNSRELQAAIVSYNSKYQDHWNFRALHTLFESELDEDESKKFFEDLLPKIIALALRLPELVQSAIPLLKQGQNHSVTLSQQQIACLLANAFLCTFPRRNTMKKKSEYSNFPDINFNRLFQSSGHQVLEKIKCICHYFRRVCEKAPIGVVTFTRRHVPLEDMPNWSDCDAPLGVTPLHITSCGTIEDQGRGLLQVDFANKFLGGGVLGSGCVQEEIRFVICPELIVSKLFTEALRPTEAVVIVGCEQYSKYSGYASSFHWDGNFVDETPFDESQRRQCHIVAIDALYFMQSAHQYREELMLRELNKAYVGFFHPLETPAPGVASGNWGCGAFGGEATLKALLQLMACTVTKRPLVYYTFGNKELRDAVHNMHTFFIENNVRVKHLWSYLKKFRDQKLSPNELYHYICESHNSQKPRAPPEPQPSSAVGLTEKRPSNFVGDTTTPTATSNTCTIEIDSSSQSTDIEVTASSGGLKTVTKQPVKLNKSQDLFASSSDDSLEGKPVKLKDSSAASGVAEPTTSPGDEKTKKPEMRQRSLLEMLDQCYTDSPSKRRCVSSNFTTK